jgi:predicted TIM-barrel fold metal-dependent hydrolase
VRALAKLPNIGCFQLGGTMSSFHTKQAVNPATILPFVRTAVQAFGYNRLCFEANWFFSNFADGSVDHMDGYGTWAGILVPMLTKLGASPADLKMVFRDNAIRVYGINTGADEHRE